MNSNWSYGPKTAKWGHDLCDLDRWPLTLIFCMDITFVKGNTSWKFQDDTMTGTLSKNCDRWTDGRTDGQRDGQTDGKKCSSSCLVTANKNTATVNWTLFYTYGKHGCKHKVSFNDHGYGCKIINTKITFREIVQDKSKIRTCRSCLLNSEKRLLVAHCIDWCGFPI